MNKICYNFGGGPKRIEGFKNVDTLEWSGVTSILWDLIKVPYEFVKEPVDEIIAIEFLEHISWRDTDKVLKEWYRILKDKGKLTIQVPDCGSMMEMFVEGKICGCVKHKPQCDVDARGKSNCWTCCGKGEVNPVRWLMAFCGAQKHGYDQHLNVFTKDILKEHLEKVGFRFINIESDKYKWKIIAKCQK